jgi:hypothetical protein
MRRRLKHTIELTIKNDDGQPVESWVLFRLSVAAIFLMTAIGMTIQDTIDSAFYWLLEWQPEPVRIWALVPIPVGYAPG